MSIKSSNVTAVAHRIDAQERLYTNDHKGGVMWFTELSGSAKTTLAFELEQRLFSMD